MKAYLRLLAGASLMALAPTAWADSFTGDFADTQTGSATETFADFGGSTLNLTATCGSSSPTCKIADADHLGGGLMSLGVLETIAINPAIQTLRGEDVIFDFGTTVTLTAAQLDLFLGNDGYIISVCTTDTCTSKTTILSSSGTGTLLGTEISPSFTATTGQFFEIAANTSDIATEFGINSLTFSSAVPEPATLSLVGVSLLGLGYLRNQRKRRS